MDEKQEEKIKLLAKAAGFMAIPDADQLASFAAGVEAAVIAVLKILGFDLSNWGCGEEIEEVLTKGAVDVLCLLRQAEEIRDARVKRTSARFLAFRHDRLKAFLAAYKATRAKVDFDLDALLIKPEKGREN